MIQNGKNCEEKCKNYGRWSYFVETVKLTSAHISLDDDTLACRAVVHRIPVWKTNSMSIWHAPTSLCKKSLWKIRTPSINSYTVTLQKDISMVFQDWKDITVFILYTK